MKPKRKSTPAHPIIQFWREFLFTREFEFETDLALEQCVAALRRLSETTQLGWGAMPRRTISIAENQLPYHFHAEHQRQQQKNRDHMPIILVDGTIDWDAERAKTIISGTASFAPAYYVGLIGLLSLWLVMTVSPNGSAANRWMALMLIGAGAIFWWSLYWERNTLIANIEQVVRDGEAPPRLSKRKSEDDAADVDEWADSFPSQQKNKH
jgi:hypothetical protein